MTLETLQPFLLERWFADYEFVPGMRNLAASGPVAPTAAEILALDGPEATAAYLRLSLEYIEATGSESLRATVTGMHPGIDPADVHVTTGASEAILMLMWSQLRPGDAIVVEDPCYESHAKLAAALGVQVRTLPLRAEDGWRPDPRALARLLERPTRLVIVNHPHNPTGSTLSGPELQALIRITEDAGALFVSDEVFRPIALEGEEMPSATSYSDRAVALGDLSKPWGMGGIRVGWVASHDRQLLRGLEEVRYYTTMCCAGPSAFLAEMALRHHQALLAPRLARARRNLDALADLVERAGGALTWQRPTAGYSAWLRLPKGIATEPFCRRLAAQRVLVLPGTVFGSHHDGYIRIGFGGDTGTFQVGLTMLEKALAQQAG